MKAILEASKENSIFQDVAKCNLYDPLKLFEVALEDSDGIPASKKRKMGLVDPIPEGFYGTRGADEPVVHREWTILLWLHNGADILR